MGEQRETYTRDGPKLGPATGRHVSCHPIFSQGPREGEGAAFAEELGSIALLIRVQKTLAGVVQGYRVIVFVFVCLVK